MNVQHDDPAIGAMRLTAIGGILGAIAASSCCIAPLVLFSLGISGAWIGNLTALAPYQPYFIAATLACLGYGYWLVYRRQNIACAEGEVCARPLPNQLVKMGLVLATVLVAGAIGLDLIGPTFLTLEGTPMLKLLSMAAFGVGLVASSSVLAAEKTVTLAVKNMYCAACPGTVKNVAVSAEDKTAVVTFDDSKAEVDALVKATTNAGYPSAPKS